MSSPVIDAELAQMNGIPRPVEAVFAGLGLVLLSPVLLVVALGVLLTSRGPVLFRQLRVGRNGREFRMWKFRTMRMNHDTLQITAKGDERITGVGRWLRQLKLDELPTLWNVVVGEMSLVGPRPEVPRYVNLDDLRWREVLTCRPGITDPVTLLLRNEEELLARVAGDAEKFYLETLQPLKLAGNIAYLRKRSAVADVTLILRTIVAVVAPRTTPAPAISEIRLSGRVDGDHE